MLAVQVLGIDALVDLHDVDGSLGQVDHVAHRERGDSKFQRGIVEQGVDAVVGHGAHVIGEGLPGLRGEAFDVALHMV